MIRTAFVTRVATAILVAAICIAAGPQARAATGDSGQDLEALLGELRRARTAELVSLRAAIAANEAREPGVDIVVSLPDFLDYNPSLAVQPLRPATITVRLKRRGGRWLPGSASGWTEGDHQADASGLAWGLGGLTGRLRLRFDPRGERTQGISHRPLNYDMIPTQTRAFTLETVLDLHASAGGKLAGTYRRAAQEGFPEVWNEAAAEVRPAPGDLLPELPAQAGPDAELAAVWRHLAGLERMRLHAGWWDETAPHLPELTAVAGDATAMAALAELGARARSALSDRAARPLPDHRIGPGGCEDPDFGPWFADQALPVGARADAVLPADAGGDGPQEWRYVGRWHVLLPLPGGLDLRAQAGVLPPVLADPRLAMRGPDGKEYAWRTVGPPSAQAAMDVRGSIRVAPPWIDPLARDEEQPPGPEAPPGPKAAQSFLAVADVEAARAGPRKSLKIAGAPLPSSPLRTQWPGRAFLVLSTAARRRVFTRQGTSRRGPPKGPVSLRVSGTPTASALATLAAEVPEDSERRGPCCLRVCGARTSCAWLGWTAPCGKCADARNTRARTRRLDAEETQDRGCQEGPVHAV